jgi:hypothetical protein
MGDIVIPEAMLDEFLKSLYARVTKVQEGLAAEMQADLEAVRARLAAHEAVLRAQMKAGFERKARAMEKKIELMEEAIVRRARALEDKLRAFEEEVERLRQVERRCGGARRREPASVIQANRRRAAPKFVGDRQNFEVTCRRTRIIVVLHQRPPALSFWCSWS